MPEPLAHFEGRIQPLADVRVSALDRGFLFGDGVYEVLRIYAGRPWLEAEHNDRLVRSLAEIRIAGVDVADLGRRVRALIAAGPFAEAMAYIEVTRGAAPRRRHAFLTPLTPTELVWVEEYDDRATQEKRESGTSVITLPDLRWARCDIKSVNLLPNVLAAQRAAERGASEALFYLPDGRLTEASHSSFFWAKDGALYATPLEDNILPGITRSFLLRLASSCGIAFKESHLTGEGLFAVDELFLSGTTSEVLPVTSVDGRPVAGGVVGPLTRQLQAAYAYAVRASR